MSPEVADDDGHEDAWGDQSVGLDGAAESSGSAPADEVGGAHGLAIEVLNDLRDREKLRGRCGHCRYKYVCGGCRARAYAYHEDYLMPDPGCIRELEEPSVSPTQAITVTARKG